MKQIRRSYIPWLFLSVLVNGDDWIPVPKWQTVVPDTGIVVALTGSLAPPWRLFSDDGVYAVEKPQLPSDVLTNLLHAGIISDPYFDRNFLTERHIWMGEHARDDQIHANRTRTWVYTTTFELPELPEEHFASDITWKLILEGIKMGAHIALNGVHLGTANNQFLRYEFDVTSQHLAEGTTKRGAKGSSKQEHVLSVTFDPLIYVDGRFTACSGGWDWAPYTKSYDAQGRRSYTFGIVKPVYLVAVERFLIRHFVPKIYYQGLYPKEPMVRPSGNFEMKLNIHVGVTPGNSVLSHESISLRAFSIDEQRIIPIPFDSSQKSSQHEVIVSTTITFHPSDVKLWWPNGMGDQPLYLINVGFHNRRHNKPVSATSYVLQKRIGTCIIILFSAING
jgi:beta-mannosidase